MATLKKTHGGKGTEKLESFYTVGGNTKWRSL